MRSPLVSFLVALAYCVIIIGCNRASQPAKPLPETLITGGYDTTDMDAAIARGRATVDRFIVSLERKEGTDFSVKAPIRENGETEHFWLDEVTYKDGVFTGKIGNEPGVVKIVKFGQTWKVKKEEISDWMFIKDKRMYGNFTMTPLLPEMDPQEALIYRKLLVSPEKLEEYLKSN